MSVWLGLCWAAGSHRAGLGVCAQLITAMHCTAHVPRAYQGPIAFQGISSSQGPAWLSLLLGIPWGRRSGRVWTSTWGPSQSDPLPSKVWRRLSSLLLLPGPILFLSYPYLGLLPWVNEPRVGPAHPSRQPLAPAASGMLQPPSFSAALAPCFPQPILPGGPSAWSHPTRTQSLTVYNSRWCFYIYSSVENPHFTQNHLIQPLSLPHPNKRFSNPCGFLGQRNWLMDCVGCSDDSNEQLLWGIHGFLFVFFVLFF